MTNDEVVMDIVDTHKLMKLSVIVLGSLSDSDVGRFALPSRIRCVLALCFDVPFLVMAVSMLPVLHVLYSWGPPYFLWYSATCCQWLCLVTATCN